MKKVQKVIMALILGAIMQLSTLGVVMANDVKVIVNNNLINFDVAPVVIEGRTMVPLRAIFEALGVTVNWDAATQTVTSSNGTTNVSMAIGNNTMWVNGNAVRLDVAPMVLNGRTLVPVRAIAESYDCTVGWDEATQTVTITSISNFDTLKRYIIANGEYNSRDNEYEISITDSSKEGTLIYSFDYKVSEDEIAMCMFSISGYGNINLGLWIKNGKLPVSLLTDETFSLYGHYDAITHRFVEDEEGNDKVIRYAELKESFLKTNSLALELIDLKLSRLTGMTLNDLGVSY